MRPPTACLTCRTRRRKCEATGMGVACYHCVAKGIKCSLGTGSPPAKSKNNAVKWSSECRDVSRTDIPIVLPPQALCEELAGLYFQYIHDTFHSLFHKPSFMRDIARGTVPGVILFAVISLAARFSNHSMFEGTDPRVRGKVYAKESRRLLDLSSVTLTTIQACVLLGACSVVDGDASTEAVYYSIACRMAMLLNLPEMPIVTELEREINVRVWWSLCMIDVWSSAGVQLPRSIIPREDVPMPMEETLFLNLHSDNQTNRKLSFISEPSHSLLAQMIKLNTILVEINAANQLAAYNDGYQLGNTDVVDGLSAKLDRWHQELPSEIHDTAGNLAYWAENGLGNVFVAVYLGYYHFGQLLYYQFLHEEARDDDFYHTQAHSYATKCKTHSINLCEILYRAYATPGCEVLYTMVGHVLVIASTVQLHVLLFSSDEVQICAARSRLERNFDILTRLQQYWSTLDVCFSRFKEFHKVLAKSKETSFRMDRWMLRFLFEFAKPIGENERDEFNSPVQFYDGQWSMQSLGFSPY